MPEASRRLWPTLLDHRYLAWSALSSCWIVVWLEAMWSMSATLGTEITAVALVSCHVGSTILSLVWITFGLA